MSLIPWWIKAIIIAVVVAGIGLAMNRLDASRQQIGYDRAMAEVTAKENESLKFLLAETERLNDQVAEAQRNAKEREAANQVLTDRVNALSSKLRNTQRSIDLSIATATADALRKATSAFNTLFGECRERYEQMGRNAAGHSSDVVTLEQAWPK